ncbi:unnamed protein product [Peniophora sp. CBMAI 1063]|nr:unnamed protein product [Peniophora sp. CBMAI 1063]
MNAQQDFRVVLIGGGIVGLICAIALAQKGVQVDIYEAATKYGEIGAGVTIQHNAHPILKDLGLLDEIAKAAAGPRLPLFGFVMGPDSRESVYQYPENAVEKDQGIGLHRAVLINTLVRFLPPGVHSHFRKRCTDVITNQDGRVEVQFADGSRTVADIVIGADGIKSAIRGLVLGPKGDRLVDTGHRCYRNLLPIQRLMEAGVNTNALVPRCWMGSRKHLVSYPIGDGAMYNMAAFATDLSKVMVPAGSQSSWTDWVIPAPRTELQAAFVDFDSDARAILEQADESVTKWKIHGLYPPLECHVGSAPTSSTGVGSKANVVLIGDAAHAMVPYLGSGASVGIEDAYELANLLSHPQTCRDNLSDVLHAYNEARVPRTTFVANASKRAGEVYHGLGPSGPSTDGRRRDLDRQFDEIWHHDAQAEVRQIVQALVDGGVFTKS